VEQVSNVYICRPTQWKQNLRSRCCKAQTTTRWVTNSLSVVAETTLYAQQSSQLGSVSHCVPRTVAAAAAVAAAATAICGQRLLQQQHNDGTALCRARERVPVAWLSPAVSSDTYATPQAFLPRDAKQSEVLSWQVVCASVRLWRWGVAVIQFGLVRKQ